MQKILFAIGQRKFEEMIEGRLGDNFSVVGTATHREGVLSNIEQSNPDIVILREKLPGNKNLSEIIHQIRVNHGHIRIIFMTGSRQKGDEFLAMLVNMQVFDILAEAQIPTAKLIELIEHPNSYQDVSHFQPKMVLDDKSKKMLFEAPDGSTEVQVKTVEKVVYVEKPAEQVTEPEQKAKKSRGLFGRRSQPNVVEEPTPVEPVAQIVPEVEPAPQRKPNREVGRNQASSPGQEKVDVKAQRAREKELEKQRQREAVAKRKEEERIRKEELARQEAREAEERARSQRERDLALREEQERLKKLELELKTIELQKKIEEMDKNKEAEHFLNQELSPHSKQKIITFIGSEHGVGNTQVALNTSIQLANNGYKTIYIELKERPSTLHYLYQLHRNIDTGLEVALFSLESQDYRAVNKSIVRMKDVIDRTSESDLMLDSYKKFPKNLDFLFFSPTYTSDSNDLVVGNPQGLKELCWHLLFEAGYHYIILDADIDKSNPYTEVALRFGSKVFYTLTQDICHISSSVNHVIDISKKMNIKEKLNYVVNKYEDADITKKSISEWLSTDVKLSIPYANRDFINANYNGYPALIGAKNKELKRSFNEIAQTIQNM
ncbi:hypothetical protein [Rossellomorea marisflavi]|uniref:response regulator/pilus assembly protein n=1 Tax=Rossellomorea marisflavi TaxID=189381 RepID=UPI003FA00FF4